MSLDIAWSYPALHDLRSIHWLHAADVDAAVMRFAETGQGNIERVPDRPLQRILRVGRYRVLMQADFRAHTLFVVRIYR